MSQQMQQLLHLSYQCPGLTGKGSVMDIKRMSYETLFRQAPRRLVIPLFQRAFCWDDGMARGWWRDATGFCANKGRCSVVGHSSGKAFFKTVEIETNYDKREKVLYVVDGQQRITTTSLLIASLRDGALKVIRNNQTNNINMRNDNNRGSNDGNLDVSISAVKFVKKLNAFLFCDIPTITEWVDVVAKEIAECILETARSTSNPVETKSAVERYWSLLFPTGAPLPCGDVSILLPSFVDRKPYFEIILSGLILHETWKKVVICGVDKSCMDAGLNAIAQCSSCVRNVHQANVKRIFDGAVATQLPTLTPEGNDAFAILSLLKKAAKSALTTTTLMYCEILNDANLSQIFLWLQEKSMFGMGALLNNPSPGKDFKASDLVRNLLLSTTMDSGLREQEQKYRNEWLDPIERRVGGGPDAVDKILVEFLASSKEKIGDHSCGMEKTLEMIKNMPVFKGKYFDENAGLSLYARFLNLVEVSQIELNHKTKSAVLHPEEAEMDITTDNTNDDMVIEEEPHEHEETTNRNKDKDGFAKPAITPRQKIKAKKNNKEQSHGKNDATEPEVIGISAEVCKMICSELSSFIENKFAKDTSTST